jgi:hypothetical protein
MTEPWVCIGHSHTAALKPGAELGGFALDTINFWETGEPWLEDGGITRLRPDLAQRVAVGQLVLSLVGGSAHTVLGMIEHPRPFDFILPTAPDLPFDENRELVPAEALRAKLTEMSEQYLSKIPVIVKTAKAPVIHIEPPPPLADEALIGPHVPWSFFPGQPQLVAPKWLRYKVWLLHSEVIAAACDKFGVKYVRAPEAAKDDEGFLRPCYDKDGAHANAAYGLLVLEKVRASQ